MNGWIVSGGEALMQRGPQDGPNVHHGLSFKSQSLFFVFVLGSWPKHFSVMHVFCLR
jgi:hypothetical protein